MIPNRISPMGITIPGWERLLDAHTRFLIWGNLTDRAGNVSVSNFGLANDGKWIYSPDTSSYAIIPENSLPSDVICKDHDWSLDINFYVPENWTAGLSQRVALFGGYSSDRFDVLLFLDNAFGVGSVATGIYGTLRVPGENLFTVNFKYGTGFSFKVNGETAAPQSPEDLTTGRNSRTQKNGLLCNVTTGGTAQSIAYMIKINYIRISNITR